MKIKFWQWFANYIAPKELLYFCVIKTWAMATAEKYDALHPDDVTWSMACKFLNVEGRQPPNLKVVKP